MNTPQALSFSNEVRLSLVENGKFGIALRPK
jgi:hypothetical protein